MAIPTEQFFKKPEENVEQYNQRIAGLRSQETITSDSLASEPAVDFQSPQNSPIFPVDRLDSATPPMQLTEPEKKADDLTTQLQELQNRLIGQSAFQAEQETAAGIPELRKTQTDLSARLKTIQNEASAIPLQLQQEATGRGITTGGLRPIQTAALRNNAIQALGISSLLEASRGNLTTAQDLADRAVAQKFDPIKEEIAVKMANLNLILKSPTYSLADKNRAQNQLDIQNAKKRQIEKEETDQKKIFDIATTAAGNGADSLTLDKIIKVKTPGDALIAAGRFIRKPEKPEIIGTAETGYLQYDFETKTFKPIKIGGIPNISDTDIPIIQDSNLPNEQKNNLILTNILKSKMGQGTRTNIANTLGVINAAEDLASIAQAGKFTGVSPLRAILDFRVPLPFTDLSIPIPFRQSLKKKGTATTEGYIEAVNLMVQRWASGAALTEAQTEQVGRFTPRVTDTDGKVR